MRNCVVTMLTVVCCLVLENRATSALANPFFSPQQKTKKKSEPAGKKVEVKPKPSPAPKKPLAEWASLDKLRKKIIKELGEFKKKFEISSRADKIKIRDSYQKLIDRWTTELEPRMTELSFFVWEKKPTEELAKNLALRSNRFEYLAKTIDRMIAAKVDYKPIYQLGAVAHFNIHNFQRAKELFAKAEEVNSLDFGAVQTKNQVENYIEFWKTERAIRQKEAQAEEEDKNPRVELKTNKGAIIVELFENQAPNTVKNFVRLVEQKKYDGTLFYQQDLNFPVYGGDLLYKKDRTKNEALGYTMECECFRDDARLHFRGSLSMVLDARRAKDSGGSAFSILRTPLPFQNPVKDGLNPRGNTVFGRVVAGMEIVDHLLKDDFILEAKVLSKRKHPYIPYTSADLEKDKKEKAKKKKEADKKDAKKDSKTDSQKVNKD